MSSPLISVIIPLYNSAGFIEQTLRSVFSQTYREFEVICVDNNSSDNTLDVIRNLQMKLKWDIQILKESNQGAPFARNLGLQNAKGDFIQFLDSDDWLVDNKLQRQISEFNSDSSLDFITAEHYEIVDGLTKYKKREFVNSWQGLISSAIGITSSALFKKSSLVKVGGFDTNLASNQEKELYFKLLKSGCKHLQLAEPLFNKNSHPDSISNTVDRKSHIFTKLDFLYNIRQFLKEAGLENKYEYIINTQYFFLFMNLAARISFSELAAYNRKFRDFNIWNSNLPIKNRLMMKMLSPIGYSFIFKTLKRLKS